MILKNSGNSAHLKWKYLEQKLDIPRGTTIAEKRHIIRTKNHAQVEALIAVTTIDAVKVNCSLHEKLNSSRSLIYLQDYDVPRIEEFASEIKEALPNITDVVKANWIRQKIVTILRY